MTARLHVLVGAGGVGKTTLAAGYALALARAGRRVGLLGIDPSRRLQGALGLDLPDLEVVVPGAGELSAALLRPADCLRRWAAEACPEPEVRDRLQRNVFFLALADRLAGASDLLAAVRVAEWAERDPRLTDLVVDTAPGLNAIEFLRRPETLLAFLEGRLVGWLRWMARRRSGVLGGLVHGGARVLGALAKIGGTNMLLELADFLLLVDGVLKTMLTRLEHARRWLRDEHADVLLVTAVHEDAPARAHLLAAQLREVGTPATAVILNRALPEALALELEPVDPSVLPPTAAAVVRYARGYAAVQRRVVAEVATIAPVIVVSASHALDSLSARAPTGRLDALRELGAEVLRAHPR